MSATLIENNFSSTRTQQRQKTERGMDQDLMHFSTLTAKLSKRISALPETIFWRAFQSIFLNFINHEAKRDSRKPIQFDDIPTNVIVSNVFPFFENRTDWNNFSLVNKDIRNAVKNHKKLVPPWPDNCCLSHDSFADASTLSQAAVSPNGEFVAFCSDPRIGRGIRGRIHILCRRKGLVQSWEAHDSYRCISSIAYSPNGKLLLSSCYDRTVKFWDAANDYTCVQTLQEDNKEVHSVAFSPNGEVIAIGGHRSGHRLLLSLWRVSDGSKIREVEFEVEREMSTLSSFLRELKFSPDGQAVAVCGQMEDNDGTDNGFLGLWKLDGTEDGCINLEGQTEGVNDLAFSPDGECLVSSSTDKTIKLWNFRTSQCVKTFTGHTDEVMSISFSPDGKFIVSGGLSVRFTSCKSVGTIRTWNLETGTCLCNMNVVGSFLWSSPPMENKLLHRRTCLFVFGLLQSWGFYESSST
jgi:WD40 repeat protein